MKTTTYTPSLALFLVTSLTCSSQLLANPQTATLPQLSLDKPDVNDDRRLDGGGLQVHVEVKSLALAHTQAVRASVISALDGDGNALFGPGAPKKRIGNPFAGQFDTLQEWDKKDGTTITLYLPNPPRSNTQVRSIRGVLEMVQIGNDPSSVVVVKNFRRLAGKPLALPLLHAYSISMVMWTKDQYKQRQKEAASKSLKSALSQGMNEMFNGLFGNSKAVDSVVFQIKDLHLRLVSIEFEDGKGRSLDRGSSWQGYPQDTTHTFDFDKKLPPDTRIKITVATDKTLVKAPFELKDVALP